MQDASCVPRQPPSMARHTGNEDQEVPGGGVGVVWPCHQQEGNAGEVAGMYFFTTLSKPFGCDFGCGFPLSGINSGEIELPQGGNESKVGLNSGGKGPASQPAIP